MKKLLFGGFVLAGLIGFVGLQSAYAQSDSDIVKVPFPFVAGQTVLPAGSYRIAPVTFGSSVMSIVRVDGRDAAEVLTDNAGETSMSAQARVQFEDIGGRRFLSDIVIPGYPERTIPLTPRRMAAVLAYLDTHPAHTGH